MVVSGHIMNSPAWVTKKDLSADKSALRAYQKTIAQKLLLAFILTGLLFLLSLHSLSVGGATYSVRESWKAIVSGIGKSLNEMELPHQILWHLRIPRVLMAIVCGIGLAAAGLMMQTILRNPLASPYTLGISSAASFGAALAIVMRTGVTSILPVIISYDYLISANAFFFTFLATFAIYFLSRSQKITVETIVLFGVAVSYVFSAGSSFLQYIGNSDELAALAYWMFGSLGKTNWSKLTICSVVVFFVITIAYSKAWDFNSLLLGDESAQSVGINVDNLRVTGLLLASLTTAVIVSMLGPIGFIGLVAPHLGRILVGGDHRYLMPISFLIGAILLVAADTLARTALSPVVIPVGIVTSVIGVPLLLYLIVKRRKEHW
jgi:iron complex transport system permease protein